MATDRERLDALQRLVRYRACTNDAHECNAHLDCDDLDTALMDSEGDLRAALDAMLAASSPTPEAPQP